MTPPMRPLVAATLLLLAPACRPKGPVNLCPSLEVASDVAAENEGRELDVRASLSGLIPTVDAGKLMPPGEIRDCREQRVLVPLSDCDNQPVPAERLPERPLDERDLVFTDIEGDDFLVWAQGHHFTDGDALGPVAIASWTRRGIRVAAVGPLRGPAKHVRLRLEPLGDGRVLIVEGDACPPDGGTCTRVVRVVPILEDQFVDTAMRLSDGDGGCGGPATFPLSATLEIRVDAGKIRRFNLQRNVVIKDGLGIVHEEAVIKDLDPGQPNAEGVEFRRVNKARELLLDKDGLIVQKGIWDDMLAEHGSVRPSDHAPPTKPDAAKPTKQKQKQKPSR